MSIKHLSLIIFSVIVLGAVLLVVLTTLFTNDSQDEEVIIRLRGEGEDAGSVELQVLTEAVVFSAPNSLTILV